LVDLEIDERHSYSTNCIYKSAFFCNSSFGKPVGSFAQVLGMTFAHKVFRITLNCLYWMETIFFDLADNESSI
jgi:hypothetical protein